MAAKAKSKVGIERYGATWPVGVSDIEIEMGCILKGGSWTSKDGSPCGSGSFHHYKQLINLLWPGYVWHKWNELLLTALTTHKYTSIVGPASSGKTNIVAIWALCEYYIAPERTTILCSTTTREMLGLRIWGEIKMWHAIAKENHPWLPGHMIESKYMLTTDGKEVEGRDFRNGIVGVACVRGSGQFQGLANYIGIKNERVRLVADELQMMPPAFVDAISNLNSNSSRGEQGFRAAGLGNPKDQTDALGKFSEPADEEGGWEGVEQGIKTTQWRTRIGGVCVQLCGPETPNADFPGPPWRYPFLITPQKIEEDAKWLGRDDPRFLMQNMGVFPKTGSIRRVITRQICLRGKAMEPAVWRDNKTLTRVLGLDASYSAEGEGDRTVLVDLQFGADITDKQILAFHRAPMVVPISARSDVEIADQIAIWVMEYAQRHGIPPERLFFDSTGRGSLMMAFSRIWSPKVNGVEFGGKATTRRLGKISDCSKKYRKFVSELWFASRHLIEAGQLRGMTEAVMEEGASRAWELRDMQFDEVEPKDETKERMGRSPDIYDAFVVGIEGARRLGFQIIGAVELAARRSQQTLPGYMQKRSEAFSGARKSFTLHTNR